MVSRSEPGSGIVVEMKIENLNLKLATCSKIYLDATVLFLIQVSGPDSKRKAVEAGLLKTVIDLLETPEPVQVF